MPNTPKEGDKSLYSVFFERRGGIVDPCGVTVTVNGGGHF
jgi:hypothetical protein